MSLPHHCYESEWTAKLSHDFPESITTELEVLVDIRHVQDLHSHSVLGISLELKYKGLILWKQQKLSKGDSMDYIAQFRVMNPHQ